MLQRPTDPIYLVISPFFTRTAILFTLSLYCAGGGITIVFLKLAAKSQILAAKGTFKEMADNLPVSLGMSSDDYLDLLIGARNGIEGPRCLLLDASSESY